MNKYSFLVCICLFLFSCQSYDDLIPEPELENLSDSEIELINLFASLNEGNTDACSIITDTSQIPGVLCEIVRDARPGSEIVFLVDKTGSMADDIESVRRNINQIIDCIPSGVFLGAATYGDRISDGSSWYNSTDLTQNFDAIRNFVNTISTTGGGDIPESMYDAIWKTLDETPWQNCDAPDKVIVMGDAPPHSDFRTTYSADDVLEKARSLCPDTEFYPVIILEF